MMNSDRTSENVSPTQRAKSRHRAKKVAWSAIIVALLAGTGWVWIHPDLCLPGETVVIRDTVPNSVNGMSVSVSLTDKETVSMRVGHDISAREEGLKAGDSVRGPWWWGRLTVVQIDPDMDRLTTMPPTYCKEILEARSATPAPIPPECKPKMGSRVEVTVRWTPW
ncbi:MAG: hypothetical protein FWD18_00215 [Micrococcales bacterium]|nr:hypothetical protein [Micrococcales bacterium]